MLRYIECHQIDRITHIFNTSIGKDHFLSTRYKNVKIALEDDKQTSSSVGSIRTDSNMSNGSICLQ